MARQILRVFSAPALALSLVSPLPALQQDSTGARLVIVVDSLDRAAFANVAELLQARVPGLYVSRTGDGGMRWFMRGPSSASESTPLVLIDDVRFNVVGSAIREFGTRPPLLDEIDLEEVERIEVWSGAATVAGHGTGAGNGVIRIATFAPRAQKTSFRIATAAGTVDDNATYPANFARTGVDTAGNPVRWCTLELQASGGCTPGLLASVNVLESDSPFETGIAARAAATVASGSERLAWRGGATFDRQGSTTGTLANQRFHLRGAAALRPSRDADLTVRAHWARAHADLPSLDEPSLLTQSLFARADTVWPGFVNPHTPQYASTRYGASAIGRWQPRPWFDARLTSGFARMRDEDDLEYPASGSGSLEPLFNNSRGERRRRDFTVRFEAETRYGGAALRHATAVTFERVESRQEEEFAQGVRGSGGLRIGRAFWLNRLTEIAGAGLTQRLYVGQRAIVSGGLRLDRVAHSKTRWDVPISPHVSIRWDARRFTPARFGGMRLRAALGNVANVPQTTRSPFDLRAVGEQEQPKAEVTREREVGLDLTGAHDRVRLSLTWYIKRTNNVNSFYWDPFLSGVFAVTQLEVLNRGIEGAVRAQILRTPHMEWAVQAWYTHNHNEVTRNEISHRIELEQPGLPYPVFVPNYQFVESGQPLGANLTFDLVSIRDLDNDGLLDNACFEDAGTCEVSIRRGPRYRPAFPPTSASLETSVRIRGVRFSALLDHRRGHSLYNYPQASRCLYISIGCQAIYEASTPLRDQAEAMLAGEPGAFLEDASYTKLREISVRFAAPASWAGALGASRLDISVAGRNVATWTDYRGPDPESTSAPWIPLASLDNAAMPLPRRFLLRLDLNSR